MLSPDAWLLFLGCAFAAEVIGTMAGFGAATILTPIAMLFMDAKTAIAVVACFHLFGNASRLRFFGHDIHWAMWLQFGITGVLCSLLGARMTALLPPSALKLALAVFLLLYVAGDVFWPQGARLPKRPWTLVGGGIVSGFIAGLIGTGGAIRSACLLVFNLPKEAYLGTSAAIALVVDGTRVPVYLLGGFLPPAMVPVLASLVLVAFSGAWLGQRLVRRVSAAVFHRWVLAMLAAMGVKLLLDGWR